MLCLWTTFALLLCSPASPNNQFERNSLSSGSWISSLQFTSNMMVVLLWVGGFLSHCFFLFGETGQIVYESCRAHMADSCGNREDKPWRFLNIKNQQFGYWNKNIFLFYIAIVYKPSSSQSQNTSDSLQTLVLINERSKTILQRFTTHQGFSVMQAETIQSASHSTF